MRKHVHIELDAVLVGSGRRCLVIDLYADLDGENGALVVDAATLRLSLKPNGSDKPVGGPYVTVGPT